MSTRSRVFRVFFSSTFSDFTAERDALHAEVFPALGAFCRRRGASFQAVDLRWGISEEAGRDQQTLEICLEEIRRCQRSGSRPNFVLLLGGRYGWRPLPPRVPAGEFEQLLAASSRPDLLRRWYALDENARTPGTEYVLRPAADGAEWAGVQSGLRETLAAATDALGWPEGDLRRTRYEASATHQEVLQGLAPPGAAEHALAYLRRTDLPATLAADDPRIAFGDYRPDGTAGLSRDLEAHKGLRRLEALVRASIPVANRHEYEGRWEEGRLAFDLRAFCDRVRADLERLIEADLARRAELALAPGGEEALTHAEFGRERCRHFVGRRELRERDLPAYLEGDSRRPLVLLGPSGAGKTALMAQAAEEAAPGRLVLRRHLGTTPDSSELRGLLNSLSAELAGHFGEPFVPTKDLAGAEAAFAGLLAKAGERRVVLFLDALDQLSPAGGTHELGWLPWELPPGVKLVASALERDGPDGLAARSARSRLPADHCLVVPPLKEDEAAGLLFDEWLAAEAGRRLTTEQHLAVQARLRDCRLPLYLRVVFEEVRRWRSFDGVPLGLAADTVGVLAQVFERLEERRHHGPVLVRRALGYLAAARAGLSDQELLGVLSADGEVLADFHAFSPTERRKAPQARLRRLPPVYWSRLYFDLSGYLSDREADGVSVLSFYHRQLAETVAARCLGGGEGPRAHACLAAYFGEQPHRFEEAGSPTLSNLRKITELGWQLERAGDLGGLDGLLRGETARGGNAWFEACEAAGRPAAFAEDVARTWKLAGEAGDLGREVRCALMLASVNTLAANVPAALMAALVEKGIWSAAQAFDQARHVIDAESRVACLVAVLPRLEEALRKLAGAEALQAARDVESEKNRAVALGLLAPQLEAEQLAEALQAARDIEYELYRSKALGELAPHLEAGQLAEALQAARDIKDALYRAEVLARLAPHLEAGERRAVLAEALRAARRIKDEWHRAAVFARLAPHLDAGQLAEVLQAARRIREEVSRVVTLAALAPRLEAGQLAQALQAARDVGSAYSRADALGRLAPHLEAGERRVVLAEALQAVRGIEYKPSRATALGVLVPRLEAEQRRAVLAEALQAARDRESGGNRAEMLRRLAPHLEAGERRAVLAEALQAVRGVGPEEDRVQALGELAPHLEAGQLAEALQVARDVEYEGARAKALAVLAPHLEAGQLAEALQVARDVEYELNRAVALGGLAPYLEAGQVAEALQAARDIRDEGPWAEALGVLAPHLEAGQLAEILRTARDIGKELHREEVLGMLAPHLEPGQLTEALQAARDIKLEVNRVKALAGLAPHLKAGQLAEALRAARDIGNAYYRAKALGVLAPHLEAGQRRTVLAEALQVAGNRAAVLAGLAPHLEAGERRVVLAEALLATRDLALEGNPDEVLGVLVPQLKAGQRRVVLAEALQAARDNEDEPYRAAVLARLAPQLEAGVRRAVLAEALLAARDVEDELYRAAVLAKLAPQLEAGQLAEALQAARDIKDGDQRAWVLAELAPQLEAGQLAEALQAARDVEDEDKRAAALALLAPHLLTSLPRDGGPVLREVLRLGAAGKRSSLVENLSRLVPVLRAVGGAGALAETWSALHDVGRWWP